MEYLLRDLLKNTKRKEKKSDVIVKYNKIKMSMQTAMKFDNKKNPKVFSS